MIAILFIFVTIAFCQNQDATIVGTLSAEEAIRAANEAALRDAKISVYVGQTKRYCEDKWTTARDGLLECLEEQTEAQLSLKALSPEADAMKEECSLKWGYDYVLTEYCVEAMIDVELLKEELASYVPPAGPPRIFRYVSDLSGPFLVTKIIDATHIEIMTDADYETVELEGIVASDALKAQKILRRRLSGEAVYLERLGGNKAFVYTFGPRGEWKGDNIPLKQMNLLLVEQGLAVPISPMKRYAHFFDSALAQAIAEQLGVSATR